MKQHQIKQLKKNNVSIAIIAIAFLVFLLNNILGIPIDLHAAAVPQECHNAVTNLYQGTLSFGLFTPITSLFIHGNGAHIVYNMVYFWLFSCFTSEFLGRRWTLFIFIITGIAATALHCIMNLEENNPVIGASGAVAGLEGIFFAFALSRHLPNIHIWPLANPVTPTRLAAFAIIGIGFDVYSIISGSSCNTAFEAHIGGFTSGILIGVFIQYVLFPLQDRRVKHKEQISSSQPFHSCHECGIDDISHPGTEFRYCGKCGEGFCQDHIQNHTCK